MTGQLGLALQAFLQEAHPDDNRDRHLVPARPQPQARLGRSHGPACVSHFQGVGSSPATPSHPHRRPPAPGTRWWFFQCLRWPRSEGFTSAISKAGHGSDSPGIPGLLSLLERPGGGGNAVRRPGGLRAPRPRHAGAVFGSLRAGVSLPANPRRQPSREPRPAQASGSTWTGPPDLPAQTAAARACCCRRPLPTRLPAAPSPSRPRRTPPCCSRAAEAAAPLRRRRRGRGGKRVPAGRSGPARAPPGGLGVHCGTAPASGPERPSRFQP